MATGDGDRLRRKAVEDAERKIRELQRAATTIFRAGKARFIRVMVREHLTGPTSQSALSRRTGQLARSLDAVVVITPSSATLTGFIGGGVPYARIHEDGGVVRPKKSKYLTIPLGPAKTAAGVTRASARNWPVPLKFIKTRKGTKLLVEAIDITVPKGKLTGGKPGGTFTYFGPKTVRRAVLQPRTVDHRRTFKVGGQQITTSSPRKVSLKPVFLLVESVAIPPRMNFRRTFDIEARRTLEEYKTEVARIMGSR